LALAALCPPWGAVFCHESAHVMADECGAPEMFTGGAKLIGVGGGAGKIGADALAASLAGFPRGVVKQVQPAPCPCRRRPSAARSIAAPKSRSCRRSRTRPALASIWTARASPTRSSPSIARPPR
jgi:hypothetical protein